MELLKAEKTKYLKLIAEEQQLAQCVNKAGGLFVVI